MKKEYKDLELETVRFDAEDVITASGGCEKDACKLLNCPSVLQPCPDAAPCPIEVICECNKALECAYSPSM